MLKSIVVGTLLTVATVGIHASGTAWWITRVRDRQRPNSGAASTRGSLRLLCATATLLLMLHISEIVVWALAYLLLPGVTEVTTLEQATYFSAVTFAALGYGDLVIEGSWRLLSAIQAVTGLLIFGWSTALFFAVYQRISLAPLAHRD